MSRFNYENMNKKNSGYFSIVKSKRVPYYNDLEVYFEYFDINDYWIVKKSANFRFLTYDELMEEKYSGYIFFNKSTYTKQFIQTWFDFIKETQLVLLYINRAFPPLEILEKIIVVDEI
jgi:hypothetical protein